MFSLNDQTYDDSSDQDCADDHSSDEQGELPRAGPHEDAIRAEEIDVVVYVKSVRSS